MQPSDPAAPISFDSQNLRSIGVTLQDWIGVWPLVVIPVRRMPLPNIIAKDVTAVSLDHIKDIMILREDIGIFCDTINAFIATLADDVRATASCSRLEDGNA
jgi:hypothetical protein